jgi:hypothetical protein
MAEDQLVFDFIKEYEDVCDKKYIIFNEEEKYYPFNIFFNSEKEAWDYLSLRKEDRAYVGGVPQYYFKIHIFKKES